MYERISNRLKHDAFSNYVYSCLWWVLYFFLCMFIITFLLSRLAKSVERGITAI